MERAIFGLFAACMCATSVLAAMVALKKKRYGLAIFCLLNAFSNLVLTIHVVYKSLF